MAAKSNNIINWHGVISAAATRMAKSVAAKMKAIIGISVSAAYHRKRYQEKHQRK
jgi:nicotinamide mononucleotide (NMN) deamidase PncC